MSDYIFRALAQPVRLAKRSWFWTALLGAGLLLGSLLALVIAATRVVLPYDEAFVGMSRAELHAVNPRLLAFMTHDRVSLAGTMVALGVLYVGLSVYGSRRGFRWAQLAILVSAFLGFGTFFLFLGFGYLDPFHAFATTALLQFLLLGVYAPLGRKTAIDTPADAPILRGLDWWGRWSLISHAVALLLAGTTIMYLGATEVFVPEDLAFMQTTAESLIAANPRLVPLVAHDRATFGGMIFSAGWVFLLSALWGYRGGSGWLWWTMLLAGLSAYVPAIAVHYAVGYVDPMHLAPAWSGLGLFVLALALSRRSLSARMIGT